jgi:hypothetical protein
MRIGVCLIGVSHSKGEKGRDWNTCAIRMKEVFGDVDYYITTYGYDIKLERFYQPKKYQVLKYKDSTQRGTYIKALENITDVDFIITTRFDTYFHYMRSEMNIDYEKFNFLAREKGTWDDYRFVNDNFFAFPISKKQIFIDAIKALDSDPLKKNFMHHIYKYIIPFTDTHFILEEEQSSKENEFYNLIRICSSPLE